jgi:hypothetical protein
MFAHQGQREIAEQWASSFRRPVAYIPVSGTKLW